MYEMSHVRKSIFGIWVTSISIGLLVAFAVWQFYLFASFKGTNGVLDANGGGGHFWVAIVSSILASIAGFFVFSVFVRYDRDDEMHITAADKHPLSP
jgi:Zn-dependent protease with chaperone function